MIEKNIPLTEGIDPLEILTNEAKIAQWKNEGLPADRISIENASIVDNCARWPLLIDPQLQGSKWIKQRYADEMEIVNFNMDKWQMKTINCIRQGKIMMIENIFTEMDSFIEPLLTRSIFHKGGGNYIKMGGDDIE